MVIYRTSMSDRNTRNSVQDSLHRYERAIRETIMWWLFNGFLVKYGNSGMNEEENRGSRN
jgi:hypothetical protein